MCIGTPRVRFDSVAPRIGSKLKELGLNVVGTVDDPFDALTCMDKIAMINHRYNGKEIIAIDACATMDWSKLGSVYFYEHRFVRPGKAVGRDLPPIGNHAILAMVHVVDTHMNPLQEVPYYVIDEMVDDTVNTITKLLFEGVGVDNG